MFRITGGDKIGIRITPHYQLCLSPSSVPQIAAIFFGGRYIILLMGLFSIYTGFIYNDIFSKSVNIFGSSWRNCFTPEEIHHHEGETLLLPPENRTCFYGTPYGFGFDPIWQISSNRVTFQNAFKMKISVLLGVLQMLFGVILSVFNYRWVDGMGLRVGVSLVVRGSMDG